MPNLQYSGNALRNSEQYKQPPRETSEYEELIKEDLNTHPNMYFVYTEDGFAREMDTDPAEIKNKSKKKASKSSGKKSKSKAK